MKVGPHATAVSQQAVRVMATVYGAEGTIGISKSPLLAKTISPSREYQLSSLPAFWTLPRETASSGLRLFRQRSSGVFSLQLSGTH